MFFYDGQIVVCVSSPIEGIEEGMVCQIERRRKLGGRASTELVSLCASEPAVFAEDYARTGKLGPYTPFTGKVLYMTQHQVSLHFMDEYEWGRMWLRGSRIEAVLGNEGDTLKA